MKPNVENYQKFKEFHEIYNEYGYLFWRYGTDNNVEIVDMGVDVRRHGYGTKLIQILKDNLKDNLPKIIFLYTRENNKTAQVFYESVGFKRGGQMGTNLLYFQLL